MVAVDTERFGRRGRVSGAAPARRTFGLARTDIRVLSGSLVLLFAVRAILMVLLPFTDTTEARYAEMARKMVETGNWLMPQFDYGVPFWGKPPLHTWLSALGMQIFGVGQVGARILIFATAIAVLALIYHFARRLRGAEIALVATVVAASSVLFFGASAFVMTDMPMVLGTTLGMVGFFICVTGGRDSRLWGYLFFLGLAIGLLAKGPVALVLTALPIGLWVLVGNRWRKLAKLPWITGLALLLILVLPWYVAAEIRTPGFLKYFLVGEHFQRFVVPGWQGDLYGSGHAKPKGIIWLFGLGMFLPWTLFALALLLRRRRVVAAFRADTAGLRSYLLAWTLAPMILFTPAANLLASYVLPGLPAAALLLVILWHDVWSKPQKTVRITVAAAVLSVAGLYLALAILSAVAPGTLGLKSAKALVAAAETIDPDLRLSYWKNRSYSAEFYSRGRARMVQGLDELGENTSRDALAVPVAEVPQMPADFADAFDEVGTFGRHSLFIEKFRQGGRK